MHEPTQRKATNKIRQNKHMNKNIIKGKCVDISSEGKGVIKTVYGVIFVDSLLLGEEAEIEVTYARKDRISLGSNGTIIMGNWHRLRAFYGFDDSSSVTGKGFYNTEYIYLSYDLNQNISEEGWFTCKLKNCFDGLNGVQIFADNDVLVHTMYSSEKLTESRLDKDAASIWETRGIETGLKVYKRKLPQPSYDQYGKQDWLIKLIPST